jgi:hypothetical protein
VKSHQKLKTPKWSDGFGGFYINKKLSKTKLLKKAPDFWYFAHF